MTDNSSQNFDTDIEVILQSEVARRSATVSDDSVLRAAAHLTGQNPPQLSSFARADILQQVLDSMPMPMADAPKIKPSNIIPIWPTLLKAVAGFVIVMLIAGIIVVPSSTNSLPGEALYPVKRQVETVRLVFSFTPESRANMYLLQAQTRADEISHFLSDDNIDLSPFDNGITSLNRSLDVALKNGLYDTDIDLLLRTEETITTYFGVISALDENEAIQDADIVLHEKSTNALAYVVYAVGGSNLSGDFVCDRQGTACNTLGRENNNQRGD